MRKDIRIPKVENVYVAAVSTQIDETKTQEWMVYIINDSKKQLKTVIIVSEGFSKTKKTSTLRKKIDNLPPKSYAKIEIIQEELFEFTNQFKVSYFVDHELYDKVFVFKPKSIASENFKTAPLMNVKAIMAV